MGEASGGNGEFDVSSVLEEINKKAADVLAVNDPHPTPRIKSPAENRLGRERYQPNRRVLEFLKRADQEAIKKGFVLPSEDVTEAELRNLEGITNSPTAELVPPEKIFNEVNNLPVSHGMTAETLLTLVPMPKHIKDRLAKNPAAELTPEELIEIYSGVKKKLDNDPKVATLDDLSLIIESEISDILHTYEESGDKIDTATIYTDPSVIRLTTLFKCQQALEKIIGGKKIKPTSAKAEALDSYFRGKINMFEHLNKHNKNPEAVALAKAGIAYFESLKMQTLGGKGQEKKKMDNKKSKKKGKKN